LVGDGEAVPTIACRGATFEAASKAERMSLTTTSLVADAIIVDGVTEGDLEMGLSNSRHARTLTALMRSRLMLASDDGSEEDEEESPTIAQTIYLGVLSTGDDIDKDAIEKEVTAIYEAIAAESDDEESSAAFEELYTIEIVPLQSESDGNELISMATSTASASAKTGSAPLLSALSNSMTKIKESGIATLALDPPQVALAFLDVSNSYAKSAKLVRARMAAWKSRVVGRGLLVDAFGAQATALYERTLAMYDRETWTAAGMPAPVASYRLEKRAQLQEVMEAGLEELYTKQVQNLETMTIKKLKNKLLASGLGGSMDENAAALRTVTFEFEQGVDDLLVPGIIAASKEAALREASSKLNDALVKFDASPEAMIKRQASAEKIANRERSPSSRAIEFGLDMVAMVRPDGFGTLQGYASYQMGQRSSVTVGFHNDADDPSVIAQFGGTRPPFLRVQPKLRVDVEM